MMSNIASMQSMFQELTLQVAKKSQEDKARFRHAWMVQARLELSDDDKKFLHEVGIDPSGD